MLSVLVVVTITTLGPIIFLKLNQKHTGEIDAIFSNRLQKVTNFYGYSDTGGYLNYTEATQILHDGGIEANLAPRLQFCGSKVQYLNNKN